MLEEHGILLSATELTISAEAAARLTASPWSADAPASTALARPDESAMAPPTDVAAAKTPQLAQLDHPGALWGITGHLLRCIALLEAAGAADCLDADEQANAPLTR
eukprot:NODE_3887_length_1967_cov_2.112500.p8 GENE.NODE_3887_length_1967_cov_2.112500~~NODE_3887_length_1967_cov_2.112500.p8  ORF type:complete len:106 (+),score=30.15 NODE_3887_length_1967_cov_2.112500:1212-1529(+)